jgi:hypothetical protein
MMVDDLSLLTKAAFQGQGGRVFSVDLRGFRSRFHPNLPGSSTFRPSATRNSSSAFHLSLETPGIPLGMALKAILLHTTERDARIPPLENPAKSGELTVSCAEPKNS